MGPFFNRQVLWLKKALGLGEKNIVKCRNCGHPIIKFKISVWFHRIDSNAGMVDCPVKGCKCEKPEA